MEWDLYWELFLLASFIGAIVVALLFDNSPAFRYRFKFAIYIFCFSTVALCMIPFCMFRPRNVKNILMGVPFTRQVSKLLGVKWQVTGRNILEKDFPCVVVCNHQSMLDIAAIVELWPSMKKCACIAKKEVFYVFPFGLMAWLCGTIYINRRNKSQSHTTLSTSAEIIKENRTKLWIFPEGTRSKAQDLLPFKKGAFHIAMANKLPIVPVVVSPYHFVDDQRLFFGSGTMQIKVLEPIATSNLEYPADLEKLVETCHSRMNGEFQKMRENIGLPFSSKEEEKVEEKVNGIASKVNDGNNGRIAMERVKGRCS